MSRPTEKSFFSQRFSRLDILVPFNHLLRMKQNEITPSNLSPILTSISLSAIFLLFFFLITLVVLRLLTFNPNFICLLCTIFIQCFLEEHLNKSRFFIFFNHKEKYHLQFLTLLLFYSYNLLLCIRYSGDTTLTALHNELICCSCSSLDVNMYQQCKNS